MKHTLLIIATLFAFAGCTDENNSLPNQDDVALTDCGGADTNPQCEVVDKVLYRSSKFITLTPVEYQVKTNEFLDEDGNWLSDHRPIFASFRYTFLR